MLGGKTIAAVFRRERIAAVECQPERGRVRLDQDIGYVYLVLQVRPLVRMMRIFVVADIEPRPAIEGALAHPGDIVGHEIVAKTIALVGRTIGVAGGWMNRKPDTIADPGRKDLCVGSVRAEGKHIGTAGLIIRTCAGWRFCIA